MEGMKWVEYRMPDQEIRYDLYWSNGILNQMILCDCYAIYLCICNAIYLVIAIRYKI